MNLNKMCQEGLIFDEGVLYETCRVGHIVCRMHNTEKLEIVAASVCT